MVFILRVVSRSRTVISKIFAKSVRHIFKMAVDTTQEQVAETRILSVKESVGTLGQFKDAGTLEAWEVLTSLPPLREAAKHLQTSDIPVGFPTETVYGLGADATRSEAVKGIYKAKGRPSDNPLIIHVSDLNMLRSLLGPRNGKVDQIPEIYKPLIKRFWPGPLTILLPNSSPSKLAPEVTAGLPTFGARMPNSALALSLIHLAGVPLAAPSANASTKPSPTTAEHVRYDLNGRIEIILDGGPCAVGVESTVVDGLCDPPVILRPGGVSIDQIRQCDGWAGVVKGYKDASELGSKAPRAPGMKYKHYSPKAKVVLYEAPSRLQCLDLEDIVSNDPSNRKIGIVRTKKWDEWAGLLGPECKNQARLYSIRDTVNFTSEDVFTIKRGILSKEDEKEATIFEINLSNDTRLIAQGLFSALRTLDQHGVDIIYVEGIKDDSEDIAAAVMNRLRKAAAVIRQS
ncbi:DHBP synthase RibB-like alpha/beta domain-containing protein [Bisporella sp. PMI_857]|nr:DHBP synthase RibB-like alpha/beta domain-containing protein [Bisporella sp. PMI_857]